MKEEAKRIQKNMMKGETYTMKKIGILLLVVFMIGMALSPVALAAELGTSGVLESAEKTITIKKQITAFNPDGSTVNAPTITYNYTIEPGTSGKTVKDPTGIGSSTLSGPTGATITSSIQWSAETAADQMETAAGGKANTKDITVDFTNVTFPSAGIYRYIITETATYTNTGVIDGESHTRYMDVYVRNSDTSANSYVIYAYVLFTNNNNIDGTDNADDAETPSAAVKTEGFCGDSSDKYYTYNLSVSKVLTDDAVMLNHQFPFQITFTGDETSVLPIISIKNGSATVPSWSTAGAMSSFSVTAASEKLKIAGGGEVVITGIPVGTSAEILEKNDVVGTTYQSASQGADTNAASKPIGPSETSNTAIVNAQTAQSMASKAVVFNNTLTTISPTGYVVRYAPYGLILIAGIVLLVIAKKHRRHTEEEE